MNQAKVTTINVNSTIIALNRGDENCWCKREILSEIVLFIVVTLEIWNLKRNPRNPIYDYMKLNVIILYNKSSNIFNICIYSTHITEMKFNKIY